MRIHTKKNIFFNAKLLTEAKRSNKPTVLIFLIRTFLQVKHWKRREDEM